ncbi:MAG TPA: hypothetical protein VNQ76_00975 [Planctomicrobium sp.]|nr:hypothetical protein [Planctomicrobium sp.]
MHLLQVCHVGQICGGTAACAWTITKAFPDWKHSVLFLSAPTKETRQAFSHCQIAHVHYVNDDVLKPFSPDLVILHNTAARHVTSIHSAMTIQYRHSQGTHARGDWDVACSKWLAETMTTGQGTDVIPVLHQPVPRPPQPADSPARHLSHELTIGRLCTPHPRKWPVSALPVYRQVSEAFPEIRWEFVGCPGELQPAWRAACQERVTFLPAGWNARSHLWRWHVLLYHHPTLTESFGRTVAESLRCGCIPVVDDRGGFREQLLPTSKSRPLIGDLCRTPDEFVTAINPLRVPAVWWERSLYARQAGDEQFSLASFRQRFLRQFKLLPDQTADSPAVLPLR